MTELELVQIVEGVTEPWEEVRCKECGAVVRFHTFERAKDWLEALDEYN